MADRIAVLTYDRPHRKTQDVIFGMIANGHRPDVLALPWIDRKGHTPLFPHRPATMYPVPPAKLCENLRLRCIPVQTATLVDILPFYERVVIGGAPILPKAVVNAAVVINSHPGFLPYVRGLDAYKWAILEGLPIGVTVHQIDSDIDRGWLIAQAAVQYQDFYRTARELYELEIRMLVERFGDPIGERLDDSHPIRRRMPHAKEISMMAHQETARCARW